MVDGGTSVAASMLNGIGQPASQPASQGGKDTNGVCTETSKRMCVRYRCRVARRQDKRRLSSLSHQQKRQQQQLIRTHLLRQEAFDGRAHLVDVVGEIRRRHFPELQVVHRAQGTLPDVPKVPLGGGGGGDIVVVVVAAVVGCWWWRSWCGDVIMRCPPIRTTKDSCAPPPPPLSVSENAHKLAPGEVVDDAVFPSGRDSVRTHASPEVVRVVHEACRESQAQGRQRQHSWGKANPSDST